MKKGRMLWGGRFSRGLDEAARLFSSSLDRDIRLAACDVAGSIAHAAMLESCGLLTHREAVEIREGLEQVGRELAASEFVFHESDEDIHTAVERRLGELAGPVSGKLHTGRSRNDQVALDERLYLRDFCDRFDARLAGIQAGLLGVARANRLVVMPAYTHLQPSQPILFSHWALAYIEMFQRDRERLADLRRRVNVSPLGAGAGAGSSLPLDPAETARLLGFEGVFANSLDAVSDRDPLVETLSVMALCAVHLSRLSEELVLWSSREFNFIEIEQRFCTGSSALPQKKNPDMVELARGRTGPVIGALNSLLVTLKGLPLSYNRDLQEDKAPFFAAEDALLPSLEIVARLLPGIRVNREAMLRAVIEGQSTAIDLAEALVRRGVPFREAHHIVGRVVRHCLAAGKPLEEITLAELRAFSRFFDRAARESLKPRVSLRNRLTPGSPNPGRVDAALRAWAARLEADGERPG